MRFLLPLSVTLLATPLAAQDLPFIGTWDCGVAIFSFTGTIYNNGSENMDITDVAVDGAGHVLTLGDGTQISVTQTSDGGLTWVSAVSGDSFTCARVN